MEAPARTLPTFAPDAAEKPSSTTEIYHPSFLLSFTIKTKVYKMSKKCAVPDAWDDDWESQADKADAAAAAAKVEEEVKVTKAERLARHAETNRKLWESACVLLPATIKNNDC